MGIALIGSLGTGVYRAAVTDHAPAAIPADAVASARDSLGGATATAHHLPGHAADLLDTAREALITALHVATGVSAALVLAPP